MKRLLTLLTGVCCTIILGTHAWALQPAEGSACQSNGDCPDGQVCELTDCPAIACDPDDPDCEPVDCPEEGTCVDEGNNGWESTCETDADCPAGFACEVVGGMSEACAAGADCPEPETTEIYGCRPAPCETDADCAGDLVCLITEVDCEDMAINFPDCAGEDCPPDEPAPPCEPTTEGQCGPKWAAACEEAADCGEGFECVAQVIDSCKENPTDNPATAEGQEPSSGSSAGSEGDGAPPAENEPVPPPADDEDDPAPPPADDEDDPAPPPADDDDPAPPTDEDDCEPTESDVKYCEPIAVECSTDADCSLEGWTCEADVAATVGAIPCPEDEPDCDPIPEEPIASEGFCVPPGWNTYGEPGGGISFEDGNTAEKNEPGPGTGGEEQNPSANPKSTDSDSSDDGGCNAGKSQGGLVLAFFALFLAVLTRRREVSQS